MHRVIHAKRDEIAALCRRYHVRQLAVFGSAARGDDFDAASSDADFIAEFDPASDLPSLEQFFGFQTALSQRLGRPVDLLEAKAIRNPCLLAGINRARDLVYPA